MVKRRGQFKPPPKEKFAYGSDEELFDDKDEDSSEELDNNQNDDLGSIDQEALSSGEEDMPLESSEDEEDEEDEQNDLDEEDEELDEEQDQDEEDLEDEEAEDENGGQDKADEATGSDEDEVVLPNRNSTRKTAEDEDGNRSSDLEESEDDYLPSAKAWGKKKALYFGTDYVDKDFRRTHQEEEELAQAEEEEAKAIQRRLLQEINEADLELNRMAKHVGDESQRSIQQVEVDYDSLSKREKLDLVKKESPELINLVEDFKSTLAEIERIKTLLNYTNVDDLQSFRSSPVFKLCEKKFFLLERYCMNIGYYLLLKSSMKPVHNHPVISGLITFKKMMVEIEKLEKKKTFRLTLAEFKNKVSRNERIELNKRSSQGENEDELDLRDVDEEPEVQPKRKRVIRFQDEVEPGPSNEEEETIYKEYGDLREKEEEEEDGDLDDEELEDEDEDEDPNLEAEDEPMDDEEEDLRRPINYQIEKNKGLTPKKKKDQRNPRVMHRKKFQKAKARRRGQVREPRKEIARYAGEFTGIKSGTVRSVRFK